NSEICANGFRIKMGERLSGWVATNRRTILNSDPILDLGDLARSTSPRLRSCLSVPLTIGDRLVGVAAFYSQISNGFNDNHRRIAEAIAQPVASALVKTQRDLDATGVSERPRLLTRLQLKDLIAWLRTSGMEWRGSGVVAFVRVTHTSSTT